MQNGYDQLVLGIDPGLNSTGWGVVAQQGSKLIYIASGVVAIDSKEPIAKKLLLINTAIATHIDIYKPTGFAIEETYVNNNALSSLKLGQARGVAILAAAQAGLDVFEYAPRFVKKSIVGSGGADKIQVTAMIGRLLSQKITDHNEADALAIAICHINCRKFYEKVKL